MDEFDGRTTREQGSPSPPRWVGSQSSGPVHQFNERSVDVLCTAAAGISPETTLQVVTVHRELWMGLRPEARRRLALRQFRCHRSHLITRGTAPRREAWRATRADATRASAAAYREYAAVQVRWMRDLGFWRDLLVASTAGDRDKLAELHLHAKLVLCGEIIEVTLTGRLNGVYLYLATRGLREWEAHFPSL